MFSVETAIGIGVGGGQPIAVVKKALRRLPMFPLPGVTLFPNALLPLHIFEERYKKLVRDALASHRLMVVSRPTGDEHEHDGRPPVASLAALGEIIMSEELSDGKFNIMLCGRGRVYIEREIESGEPYRLITATRIADDASESKGDLREAEASLRALVEGLSSAIPEGGELLRQVVAAQESPGDLADVLASALVVDPRQRQRLLETTNVSRRIEQVSAEVAAMTSRITPAGRAN